jgi:hypothetical protein
MALKLVLIGPRGTIFQDGKASILLLDHLVEFIKRMAARGVRVALWSRHPVTITVPGKPPEEVEAYLSRRSGVVVTYYRAAYGLLPDRAKTDSVLPILNEVGVERHETILVGNDETDLRAGVNNKLLLIRPGWYPSPLEYGFAVNDFSELIQFCELFALRQHPIYWSIDRGTLSVKAMGPFSTNIPDFTAFGVDARSAAKQGGGEPKFWFLMVVSSLYFSGLMHQVDYIARFPGHNPNLASDAAKGIDGVLSILGKCFNKTFLPDLILRHVAAQKSQYVPSNARTFRNHLNTLIRIETRSSRQNRPLTSRERGFLSLMTSAQVGVAWMLRVHTFRLPAALLFSSVGLRRSTRPILICQRRRLFGHSKSMSLPTNHPTPYLAIIAT